LTACHPVPTSIIEASISSRLLREEVNAAMRVTVTGKHTDTSAALRQHVEASLGAILGKYFKTAIEAHVVFSKEAHLCRAEISFHIGRGIDANASAVAPDSYAAFDAAAERLAKQMRRSKRRLHKHHAQAREASGPGESAAEPEEEPTFDAEMGIDLPTPRVRPREI
jgi:ribosomal subunit interface protein